MALYGENNIDVKSLKIWADNLKFDGTKKVTIGGYTIGCESVDVALNVFQENVRKLEEENNNWQTPEILENFTKLFMHTFFKVDNNDNAIRIANYYECLIEASDLKTKKQLVRGFDYQDFGSVNILDKNKNLIGNIGMKSDLIFQVFIDYFLVSEDDMIQPTNHTMANHEEYMSIQLYDTAELKISEIENRVKEILIECSVQLGLNFNVVKLDKKITLQGIDKQYQFLFEGIKYEEVPVMYFINGIKSDDLRMEYLSYYHVIEYFFERVKRKENIQKKLIERKNLKLVLEKGITHTEFISWLKENEGKGMSYDNSPNTDKYYKVCIGDNRIIEGLANRIYYYRCGIAHAKDKDGYYVAIPELSNQEIERELPLIKFVAYQVISNLSESN